MGYFICARDSEPICCEILSRYVVVFIGYSADDPPMQYLLEALNKTSGMFEGVYAFQSGNEDSAASRWEHKGIRAISYDGSDGHSALWSTLAAWADRADDPEAWTEGLVQKSKSGPDAMRPHERGQIAHIVSTVDGARKFASGDNPPPATWLCVFDPYRRYAAAGRLGGYAEQGSFVDPFDLYAIDSDTVPERTNPDSVHSRRGVPAGAWDAFALNRLDRVGLREDQVSSLKGLWSRQ